MRKTLVAAAVAAIVSTGTFLTTGANAMTLTTPAGLRAAIEDSNVVEPTRYVCYRVRRAHGGWKRVCSWRPNRGYYAPRAYYGGGYGYRPYRPYGYYGHGHYGRPGVVLRF